MFTALHDVQSWAEMTSCIHSSQPLCQLALWSSTVFATSMSQICSMFHGRSRWVLGRMAAAVGGLMCLRKFGHLLHATHIRQGRRFSITRISLACHCHYSNNPLVFEDMLKFPSRIWGENVQCYLQQNDVCDAMEEKEKKSQ